MIAIFIIPMLALASSSEASIPDIICFLSHFLVLFSSRIDCNLASPWSNCDVRRPIPGAIPVEIPPRMAQETVSVSGEPRSSSNFSTDVLFLLFLFYFLTYPGGLPIHAVHSAKRIGAGVVAFVLFKVYPAFLLAKRCLFISLVTVICAACAASGVSYVVLNFFSFLYSEDNPLILTPTSALPPAVLHAHVTLLIVNYQIVM